MLTVDEAQQRAHASWEAALARARLDVNAFMELSFQDDQTTGTPPFRQQWFHREWQRAWCEERVTVLHGATGFGKSDQVIGYLLWRLGHDPTLRIGIFGKNEENAKRTLAKIKRQIDENPMIRAVFPDLAPGEPWGLTTLRLAKAGLNTTTNTVQIYGIDGGSPTGARFDIILLDDIIDDGNTRTEEARQHTLHRVDTVLQSRLTTRGQMHMLANAWHLKDAAFTLGARPGVWHKVYPAWDHEGKLLWPSFRPRAWLEQKQQTMTPTEFAQMFLCSPRDDRTRVFKAEWLQKSRMNGRGVLPTHSYAHDLTTSGKPLDPVLEWSGYTQPFATALAIAKLHRDALTIVVGVDLATGESERARKTDFTVFFVLGLDTRGHRHVLWIEKGRWSAAESLLRLKNIQDRYRPDRYVVETNATQRFFLDMVRMVGDFDEARVMSFQTSARKWHPSEGIEGIGIEMQGGCWTIPNPVAGQAMTPEQREVMVNLDAWTQDLLDFSRTGHTPDTVMGSYFAKEGAMSLGLRTTTTREALSSDPDPGLREAARVAFAAEPEPAPHWPEWAAQWRR